jgi:hypothetical protein
VEFHFASSARDVNLDGRQTTALHSQVELFVSFAYSVALKTSHGEALATGRLKARANRADRDGQGFLLSAASTWVAGRTAGAALVFALRMARSERG